jgi:PAS domain S-box-containing protein
LRDVPELRAAVDETALLSVSDASGKILYVNQNLLRASGYQERELVGKHHNLMNSGYHTKEFFQQMWQTISRGEIWRGEICNRSKYGQTLWFDTVIYPVIGSDGQPEKFFALRFDVTEKVRSSRLVAAFFDVSNAPNFILDDHGFFKRANPAFCAASGRSKNDLIGRHFSSLVAAKDRGKIIKARRKALLGRKANALQITLISRHGEKRIMDLRFNRFEGQIFGSANDITEQWARQQSLAQARKSAEEASQSKTAFLANMSHEIRTPLNAIIGITEALHRDPELNPRQKELVKTIFDAGDMLEGLLSDILDLSKIEAGKLRLEAIPFCPLTETRSALKLHMQKAQSKGLNFTLDAQDETERHVIGDPLRLRQIVSNLASNAVKFTEQGDITCSMSLQDTAQGTTLAFEIADSGIGFPSKTHGCDFERFAQQRITDTRTHGGTGLGLAISASLARNMGGTLTVDSAPGEGATFTLRLPLEMEDTTDPVPEAAAKDLDTLDLRGRHVLIAEDSKVNQKVISLVLQTTGCEITFAENGAEAVDLYKASQKPFDLVLMDMRMPEMNGEEATRSIRAYEAKRERPRTPIIMLSANTMRINVRDALAAGCDAHVAKPVRRGVLFQEIADVLNPTKQAHALETSA